MLAATMKDQEVALLDLDSGAELTLWRAPESARWNVRDLAFSQDGAKLALYAGSNREIGDAVWVLNTATREVESRLDVPFSYSTHCGGVRLSPDGQRLYVSISDHSAGRCSVRCIDLAAFANVKRWYDAMGARPAVKKGMAVPA
jgi:Tol biopolymer transport system component